MIPFTASVTTCHSPSLCRPALAVHRHCLDAPLLLLHISPSRWECLHFLFHQTRWQMASHELHTKVQVLQGLAQANSHCKCHSKQATIDAIGLRLHKTNDKIHTYQDERTTRVCIKRFVHIVTQVQKHACIINKGMKMNGQLCKSMWPKTKIVY